MFSLLLRASFLNKTYLFYYHVPPIARSLVIIFRLEFSASFFLIPRSQNRALPTIPSNSHALRSPLPFLLRHSGDAIISAQWPPGIAAFPWRKDHGNIAVLKLGRGGIVPAAILEYQYYTPSNFLYLYRTEPLTPL